MTLLTRRYDREPHLAAEAGARPRHIAIIMDGNGRWAAARALPRSEGHRRGVEALRRTVRASIELGIETLTVYSFSLENWSRPADEVSMLMMLLRRFIRNDLAELHEHNVRIRVIGMRTGLPSDVAPLLVEAEQMTRDNDGLNLVIAFNYGGRQEIVAAARELAADVAAGRMAITDIDEAAMERRLLTSGFPDPDLVIRTSGEQRVSNFLLWQGAYAEFVFLPILWPDFDRAALEEAISLYVNRERRFGGRLPADQKTA